ncbi:MAG: PIN domain-containing protein [Bacteroidetes bacterium]|nr:PIN domain-containing protein [Bacteroidota bacterium]
MTGFKKIFFDTSPFIYLLEDHQNYSVPVRNFIVDEYLVFESSLLTSTITYAEFFVKPKANSDQALIEKFKNKIKEFHFKVFDITAQIAEFSCDLRVAYQFLKTADALQLATAISCGSNKFLTNDYQLKRIKEIEVITIEDLIKS